MLPVFTQILRQNLYKVNAVAVPQQRFLVRSLCSAKSSTPEKTAANKAMFDNLVKNNKVVVFMKGTPQSPRCGFSNAVVQILRMHGVQYDSHDVLANDEIRQGIKEYSDWPTIPQVFINGEFVGGCDILLHMHQEGLLIEELQKAGITSELQRLADEAEEKEKKKRREAEKESSKEK